LLARVVFYVSALCLSYLLEYQVRSHVIAMLILEQQRSQSLPPKPRLALSSERCLLEETFQGDIPAVILQARIDLGDLQLGHVIGQGEFGRVHLAVWHRALPQTVAAKVLERKHFSKPYLETVIRAAELELSLPAHEHTVRLFGIAWSIDTARLLTISEYCSGGSLLTALENKSVARWSAADKLCWTAALARGIAHLHSQSPAVVHRDLKPDNILLAEFPKANSPKIADFGSSRYRDGNMSDSVGTPMFSAPEQLARQYDLGSQYDLSIDIWAFGCILVCIARCSTLPYSEDDLQVCGACSRVAAGELAPSLAAGTCLGGPSAKQNLSYMACVRSCCQFEPALRPSADRLAHLLAELSV